MERGLLLFFVISFFLMLCGFNVHIQSKLLQHTFIMGASSDLGQPFRPRPKMGFRLGKE